MNKHTVTPTSHTPTTGSCVISYNTHGAFSQPIIPHRVQDYTELISLRWYQMTNIPSTLTIAHTIAHNWQLCDILQHIWCLQSAYPTSHIKSTLCSSQFCLVLGNPQRNQASNDFLFAGVHDHLPWHIIKTTAVDVHIDPSRLHLSSHRIGYAHYKHFPNWQSCKILRHKECLQVSQPSFEGCMAVLTHLIEMDCHHSHLHLSYYTHFV